MGWPLWCCCEPDEVPAETCPPDPCEYRTVVVSFVVEGRGCGGLETVGCVPCNPCGSGEVRGCDCSELAELFAPELVWGTGLAPAACYVAWHTHFLTSGSPCVGTLVPCGWRTVAFDEVYAGELAFSLLCGAGGFGSSCDGDDEIKYWPNEAAWVAGNGLRISVHGCCCGECECAGAPLCSELVVTIDARWTKDVTVPQFGYFGGVGQCDCGEAPNQAFDFPASMSPTQFGHNQTLSVRLERRLLESQPHCALAAGGYQVKSADWATMHLACWVGGLLSDGEDCTQVEGWLISEAGEVGLACGGAGACGKAALSAAGWDVSVEVL